jgi:hypothetical protein
MDLLALVGVGGVVVGAIITGGFSYLSHQGDSDAKMIEPGSTVPPKSASRAFILGSARPALISLLSLSTISAGVFLGAPTPHQLLAS